MAKNQAVWGIDIGNTSLKALRCGLSEEPGKVEALACDFIEHSKVLSQPGTDVNEVLAETLQTFLSRNVTKGDRIAISVSGQNTISRFLPLPPVDPKKIPDVIRYEAKQWLPFDINDVVFDFQPLGKPAEDSEETLTEAMVGMFAIKKDVATKALAPYLSRSVDIDSIQSSPIALYNFIAFDQLPPPSAETSSVDTPQESLITLCIGTDATDVVITNGDTIWIRNIPLGGNSFTKALTRELQLTFSKAEYLKRNIATSKDIDEQKRVITAMRSVFNDMVNEVNRSLEYYQTLNRKATFKGIVALGNAVKLPGLRQFLAQNLGYEVVRLNKFNNLVGTDVLETQLFKDNMPSFGVCYGLALQQLGVSSLRTNLIPREVVIDRIIREKKPWVLAASAALLLGITVQFAGAASTYSRVATEAYTTAENKAKSVQTYSSDMKSKTGTAVTAFNTADEIGKKLTSNVEGRVIWLELLRAINAALPQSQPGAADTIVKPTTSANFAKQDRVYIESVEAIPVDDLAAWFAPLKDSNRYYPDDEELAALQAAAAAGGTDMSGMSTDPSATTPASTAVDPAAADPVATSADPSADPAATADGTSPAEGDSAATMPAGPRPLSDAERFALVTGPGGGGDVSTSMDTSSMASADPTAMGMGTTAAVPTSKVVQIVGFHYHNPGDANEFAEDGGEAYLQKTLLRNLKFLEVELPPTLEEQKAGMKSKKVKMSDLGISYPTLLYVPSVVEQRMVNPDLQPLPPNIVLDPEFTLDGTGGGGMMGGASVMTSSRGGGGMGMGMQRTLRQYANMRGVKEPLLTVRRFDFVIQFAWNETPPSVRKQKLDAEAAAAAGAEGGVGGDVTTQ